MSYKEFGVPILYGRFLTTSGSKEKSQHFSFMVAKYRHVKSRIFLVRNNGKCPHSDCKGLIVETLWRPRTKPKKRGKNESIDELQRLEYSTRKFAYNITLTTVKCRDYREKTKECFTRMQFLNVRVCVCGGRMGVLLWFQV